MFILQILTITLFLQKNVNQYDSISIGNNSYPLEIIGPHNLWVVSHGTVANIIRQVFNLLKVQFRQDLGYLIRFTSDDVI